MFRKVPASGLPRFKEHYPGKTVGADREGNQEETMANNSPRDGAPGTTEQSPRWEGPAENRPRGYMTAKDDPDHDRDAVGENLRDPRKKCASDAMKTKDDQ